MNKTSSDEFAIILLDKNEKDKLDEEKFKHLYFKYKKNI